LAIVGWSCAAEVAAESRSTAKVMDGNEKTDAEKSFFIKAHLQDCF
jgi:hypothetical protein